MSVSDATAATAARCPFLAQLEQMPRLTEARYEDALGELYEGADPLEVAQRLFDQDGSTQNAQGASALFTSWGQFIDHDLSLTPEGETEHFDTDAFPHDVPRSEVLTGTGEEGPREFGNAITWQIDASMVYGSNDGREADLRAFEGGRLRMTEDPTGTRGLLPQATPETVMAGDTEGEDAVFLAGDVRANENPNLLSLHTLMAREHNYWADRLAEEHPDWTDEQLFQGARDIVEYTIQKITYEEWLPLLVGGATPTDIEAVEHDADVDGQVALEFSTAAFRFGHTLVASRLERLNEDGSIAEGGHLALMEAFFNAGIVREGGIDSLLRGQAGQSAEALDTQVIDDLNFFLQTPDGMAGFSLPALNLLRGADHGMGSYVDVRAQILGDIDPAMLDPQDFSIITADLELQAELAAVYDDVFQVDLWVGGLAEDPSPGAMMGPLFTHIVSDQFIRTATADDTFGDLDPGLGEDILADVRASSLDDVILRNTDIDSIQENPFLWETRELTASLGISGTGGNDAIEVAALDVAGNVVAGAGDDVVTVTGGSIIAGNLELGRGDDLLEMTSGGIEGDVPGAHSAGQGNDSVVLGGTARIEGTLNTGGGRDSVQLADVAYVSRVATGRGADTFVQTGRGAAESVDLGQGSDFAQLSGSGVGEIHGGRGQDTLAAGDGTVTFDDGSDRDGVIEWRDGEMTRFTGFEVVTCFTPGTLIVTALGKRPIETLRPGARVMTLDAGLQPVRWIGRSRVPATGRLAPVRIDAGVLGNTRPLSVSPQHRMVLSSGLAEMLFGATDVLAPALALTNRPGVTRSEGGCVEYIHILFDSHQIVLAEGIPSESFHPGVIALSSLEDAARAEVLALFPGLDKQSYGKDARPALRGREAQLLADLVL